MLQKFKLLSTLAEQAVPAAKVLSVLHGSPIQEHLDLGNLAKTNLPQHLMFLHHLSARQAGTLQISWVASAFICRCMVLDEITPWISQGPFLNVMDVMLFLEIVERIHKVCSSLSSTASLHCTTDCYVKPHCVIHITIFKSLM